METWSEAASGRRRGLHVAFILGGMYSLSFLDRQLLSLLAEPIRQELMLTDTQLGLLSGFTFALFYSTFGVPVAMLADRYNRVRIVAAACILWSSFTAATGLAHNVVQLALARIGVGIGEAGGSPPSYSIIADYFPPSGRAGALAIYSLGVPFGTTAGVAMGGWLAATYGWRTAFVAIGLFGCLYALFILAAVREPVRGALDTAQPVQASFVTTLRSFAEEPVIRLTTIAASFSTFVGYAMLTWAPALLMRDKGMSLEELATYYSIVAGLTGTAGTLLSGYLANRFAKSHPQVYGLVPALGFLLSAPFWAMAVTAATWTTAVLLLIIPFTLCSTFMPLVVAIVQNRVAPAQRSTASSIQLLFMNVVGLGGGPLFIGLISDGVARTGSSTSLQIAMLALTPLFLVVGAAHWLVASTLKKANEVVQ